MKTQWNSFDSLCLKSLMSCTFLFERYLCPVILLSNNFTNWEESLKSNWRLNLQAPRKVWCGRSRSHPLHSPFFVGYEMEFCRHLGKLLVFAPCLWEIYSWICMFIIGSFSLLKIRLIICALKPSLCLLSSFFLMAMCSNICNICNILIWFSCLLCFWAYFSPLYLQWRKKSTLMMIFFPLIFTSLCYSTFLIQNIVELS